MRSAPSWRRGMLPPGRNSIAIAGLVGLSGTILANGWSGTGGTVGVTGNNVSLVAATINASGMTGGGTVNIGGDAHGDGTLPQAQTVSVDSATVINVDALRSGRQPHLRLGRRFGSLLPWGQVGLESSIRVVVGEYARDVNAHDQVHAWRAHPAISQATFST